MKNWVMATVVVAAALGAHQAWAQDVNLSSLDDGDDENRLYVRTGAEYGFVAGVGYARTVRLGARGWLFGGDVTAPWAGLDAADVQLRLHATVPVLAFGGWRVAGKIAPAARRTVNEVGTWNGLGLDLGLLGGYYGRRWFVAAEAGYDWSFATYVQNSDAYRQYVFPGARDGWYGNTGGNIRTGAQAGVSFGAWELVLRLGRVVDRGGEAPLLPVYGTLAVAARW